MNHKNRVKRDKFLYAKYLRRSPTEAEEILWNDLKQKNGIKPLGCKVRRQEVILGYIVDFYIPKHRIVVELDGLIHDLQKTYDQNRTIHIERNDFRVIRFRNEEIIRDIERVKRSIISNFNWRVDRNEKVDIEKNSG